MTSAEPRLLLDGLCFPEGPRWHQGRLYFSDMHGHEVLAVDLEGKSERIAEVAERPSGLGFLPDGRLLVVSMTNRKLLRLGGSGLEQVADLSALANGNCNDMVVDAQGRAYVGNFGFDFEHGESPKPTCLVLVTPDGSARVVAEDLLFPNGCAVTPDGRTLIVAETMGARLTAFDIAEDGSLSNRRVWAQLHQVYPDGICLDAEGCVWVANPRPRGGFVRVAEGGEVKAQIDSEDRAGYACMLGGPQRRTLFLLEAFSVEVPKSTPGNGRIRVVEVDVPGAGWPAATP
jgi:sugar lactone lactonase YvrE